MSIATVVTFGFGTFGDVNKLPVFGFDIGEEIVIDPVPSGNKRNLSFSGLNRSTSFAGKGRSGSFAGKNRKILI